MEKALLAQKLAHEVALKINEKKKEADIHAKSKQGVLERTTRSIALRTIERNAHVLMSLFEKERSSDDEGSITERIIIKKMATLIDHMKSDMDKILK